MQQNSSSRPLLGNRPILPGFVGELLAIEYREIPNYRGVLKADQYIDFYGKRVKIANKGEKPKGPVLVFTEGVLFIKDLTAAGYLSYIRNYDETWTGDAITIKQLSTLIGKTLRCIAKQKALGVRSTARAARVRLINMYAFDVQSMNPSWN